MTLHGGRADGDRSPKSTESLYDFYLATYDTGDTFDQSLAKGFDRAVGPASRRWPPRATRAPSGRR